MAKVIFICEAVDINDPILATTVSWIEEFSKNSAIEKLTVLTLRRGDFNFSEKVGVRHVRGGKLAKFINFYREILKHIKETDYFFIYMGGPYPLLLLPFKLFWRKPVYQWKSHPRIGPMMRFYAYFCDNLIFASTKNAFPLKSRKVRIVGQGVDTEEFRPLGLDKAGDLVTVGRISPVKRLEKAIKLLASYNRKYQTPLKLHIYGPVLEKDKAYADSLKNLSQILGVEDLVQWHGRTKHDELPQILNSHRVFVSFNDGALDKAVVEALACGLPVLTPNNCVEEILPEAIKEKFIIKGEDIEDQMEKLDKALLFDKPGDLSLIVKEGHSIKSLIFKIISEINWPKNRVIAFHDINDGKKFREKMEWLQKRYEIVSLEKILKQDQNNKSKIAITLDDGYASWHEIVASALRELKIPATFFVCSGFIGLHGGAAADFRKRFLKRNRRLFPLTVDQLKDLAGDSLFDIGGHTVHHMDLGRDCSKEEITSDKKTLEEWTGKKIIWFAYPFGQLSNTSEKAVSVLKENNFNGAFTIVPGFLNRGANRFYLHRDSLNIKHSNLWWRLRLSGWLDFYYQRKFLSKRAIIFLGKTKYSCPLDETSAKKFSLLSKLGRIFVIGYSTRGKFERFENHAVFYLAPRLPFAFMRRLLMFFFGLKLSLWLIFTKGAKIIVAEDSYEGFTGAWAKIFASFFGKKIKLIIESHGDFERAVFLRKKILGERVYFWIMKKMAHFALSKADILRGVSKATVDQLIKWSVGKTVVKFPAWTDISVFKAAAQRRSGEKNIIFAGDIIPLKGVDILIDAFDKISSEFPDVNLFIVGEEKDKDYAGKLKDRERVLFLGKISQKELAEKMSECAILVLPSYSEALGRVILEAMAAGLAVIGSRVGGIPDMIKDGETGLLFAAGDKIGLASILKRIMTDDELIQKLAGNGQKFAESFFSEEKYLNDYEELFKKSVL